MAELRIVCTNQIPIANPTAHAHIVAVGIDTNNDGNLDYTKFKLQNLGVLTRLTSAILCNG